MGRSEAAYGANFQHPPFTGFPFVRYTLVMSSPSFRVLSLVIQPFWFSMTFPSAYQWDIWEIPRQGKRKRTPAEQRESIIRQRFTPRVPPKGSPDWKSSLTYTNEKSAWIGWGQVSGEIARGQRIFIYDKNYYLRQRKVFVR